MIPLILVPSTAALTVLIVLSIVVALIVLMFILAVISDKMAFGKRSDLNPLLKYYSADRFGLEYEQVEIKKGKNTLRGMLYGKGEVGKPLLIFCHGMGPGHTAYTTEIAYFCRHGYQVLAFDSTGSNLSDGKSINGMYEGVKTAVAAIDFAKTDSRLNDMPICLIGHSWGAYSVLCASAERKVEGVIAISGFNSPTRIVQEQASAVISRPLAVALRPFWYVLNVIKFGRRGNATAAKSVKLNGAPTLLIHGDADNIVPIKLSAYEAAEGENVTKYLSSGKAHNPYVTENADSLMQRLIVATMKVKKTEEDLKFFETFDYEAATEEDEQVMSTMSDFIDGIFH